MLGLVEGSDGDFRVLLEVSRFDSPFLVPFLVRVLAVVFFRHLSSLSLIVLLSQFILFFVFCFAWFRLDPTPDPYPDLPPDRRLAPGGQKRGFFGPKKGGSRTPKRSQKGLQAGFWLLGVWPKRVKKGGFLGFLGVFLGVFGPSPNLR